jgi:hypothetical protein
MPMDMTVFRRAWYGRVDVHPHERHERPHETAALPVSVRELRRGVPMLRAQLAPERVASTTSGRARGGTTRRAQPSAGQPAAAVASYALRRRQRRARIGRRANPVIRDSAINP